MMEGKTSYEMQIRPILSVLPIHTISIGNWLS